MVLAESHKNSGCGGGVVVTEWTLDFWRRSFSRSSGYLKRIKECRQ